MRQQLLLCLATSAAALAVTAGSAEKRADPPKDVHAANKKIGRAINLGNALEAPREGEWGVVL
jgi:endoglucanase